MQKAPSNLILESLFKNAKDKANCIALKGLGGHILTFGELEIKSLELGNLIRKNVFFSEPAVIAVISGDLALFSCLTFGIWRNNDIVVPLDIRIRWDELEKMVRKLKPDILLIEEHIYRRLGQSDEMQHNDSYLKNLFNNNITRIKPLENSPELLIFSSRPAVNNTYLKETSLILYTSGSTSQPKGVLHSLNGISHNVESIINYFPIHNNSRVGITLPLHYSYSLIGQILLSLTAGASAYQIDTTISEEYINSIIEDKISIISSVAFGLIKLLQFAQVQNRQNNLECISSAGMRFDQRLYQQLKTIFPTAVFFNQYGFAEAGPRVTAISDDDKHFLENSIGKPILNTTVSVLQDDGNIAYTGQGMLLVKTPSAMLGYDSLLQDGYDGFYQDWLISGDHATISDNGYVFLDGRETDFANVYGEKISLIEIEDCIKKFPGVIDSGVISINDNLIGNRIVAYIEGINLNESQLELYLLEKLSPQKNPHEIINISEIPRNSSGKLLKPDLLKIYEQKNH